MNSTQNMKRTIRAESDPFLAANWRASKVLQCLEEKKKADLVAFLRERHKERFFDPIQHLKSGPDKPPCTDPYARWCGRGRWVTAAPYADLTDFPPVEE